MKRIKTIVVALTACLFGTAGAEAHAFLDYGEPRVGSTLEAPPERVELWFTMELEPAFSTLAVVDKEGKRVDKGDVAVDADDPVRLRVSLPPLPPATYRVVWRVVAIDTHATEGDFKFQVSGK
jgi:methionine-rich copper-binding protein CopC